MTRAGVMLESMIHCSLPGMLGSKRASSYPRVSVILLIYAFCGIERRANLDDPVRRPGNIERYPRLRQRFCITSVITDTDLQITTVVARPLE